MGEFHDAVSHLLEAFARGLSIIKTQRGRRRKNNIVMDSTAKSAETHLSRTLKHNSVVVQDAYGKDLARHGLVFAKGDAEAHSALSSILLRLNAGFVSVIERFTRGLSTPSDYETLLSLSNASRQEAIYTFSLLSQRLYSRSSLSLAPLNPNPPTPHRHRRRRTTSSTKTTNHVNHGRSKSAPELSMAVTPLGMATPDGWVRPKTGMKAGRGEHRPANSSASSTPRQWILKPRSPTPPLSPRTQPVSPRAHLRARFEQHSTSPPPPYSTNPHSPITQPRSLPQQFPAQPAPVLSSLYQTQSLPLPRFERNRMSFASDSTKLGEIPSHKWARNGGEYPILAYYPLEPYQEPEKPRSRLKKLFSRS